jgi:hypothetical protein
MNTDKGQCPGHELRELKRIPLAVNRSVVGRTFLSAGAGDFPVARLEHRTGKSGEPAGWKACPTFRFRISKREMPLGRNRQPAWANGFRFALIRAIRVTPFPHPVNPCPSVVANE